MKEALEPLLEVMADYGVTDIALLQELAEQVSIRDYPANTPIIRQGEYPENFYVVKRGLVRYFYTSDEGKERNKTFFREGQFTGSLSSLLLRQPCRYSVAAVEHSCLYVLPLKLVSEGEQPAQFTALLQQLIAEMFLRNEEREALLLTANAEQRYRWLLQNEGWMKCRIPQYHLASYLGMDAVSLSRIKKKLQS